MKITFLLVCTCTVLSKKEVSASAIKAPLDVITLDDISPEERRELDYLQHKLGRPKRSGSGSGDLLETLKAAIGQGIKNKIGQIAKGSAAASARFSSSSSSGSGSTGYGYGYHSPHPHESYDHKSFDFWSLKKSILNTLLQAVKAIKGGVIAVKGQLIKGGGHLISAKGKLISAKGEAITTLGKNIAASAVLVPYHGHSSPGHAEYGPPYEAYHSGPSGPAPEDIYHGSPSAPGPEYHEPEHFPHHHEDKVSHGGPEGILILKKIPSGKAIHHPIAEESKVPAFKPIQPSGPSFGTIVGKLFSASSSLDPHQPELFGNTASADTHTPYHSESHHQHHEESVVEHKDVHHHVKPGASGYVIKDDDDHPSEEIVEHKPSSNFGTSFEQEPSYLGQSFDEHTGFDPNKAQAVNGGSVSSHAYEKPPTPHVEQQHTISSHNYGQTGLDYPSISSHGHEKPHTPHVEQQHPISNQNYAQTGFDYPSISSHGHEKPLTPHIEQQHHIPSQNYAQTSFEYPPLGAHTAPGHTYSQGDYNQYKGHIDLPNIDDYPNGFPPAHGGLPGTQSSNDFLSQTSTGSGPNIFDQTLKTPPNVFSHTSVGEVPAEFLGQQPFSNEVPNFQTHNQHMQSPHHAHGHSHPPRLSHPDSASSSSKYKYKRGPPKRSTSSKRPSSTRTTHKRKPKPKQTYDVVRSISYKLGPNGPKRLT